MLAVSLLLSACQPVPLSDPGNEPPTGFKPPPKIKIMAVEEGELTEEQAEERAEAVRWNAIYVCFRCHDMSERAISQQPRRRQKKHRKAMKKKRSCLDCHNKTDVTCCHDNIFPSIERWQ